MSQILEGPRRTHVWGKDIEPDYVERPAPVVPPQRAGQGVRIAGLE